MPLLSISTSVGRGSLSGGKTWTFIHGGSGPLVVLHGLCCCSFPLTLITGHGNSERCPKSSPIRCSLPYFCCGVVISHWWSESVPQPAQEFPSSPIDLKVQGAQSGQMAILISTPMEPFLCLLSESIPPFANKTSRPTEHKGIGTGSKNVASETLGVTVSGATPISIP